MTELITRKTTFWRKKKCIAKLLKIELIKTRRERQISRYVCDSVSVTELELRERQECHQSEQ